MNEWREKDGLYTCEEPGVLLVIEDADAHSDKVRGYVFREERGDADFMAYYESVEIAQRKLLLDFTEYALKQAVDTIILTQEVLRRLS